MAEGEEEEEEHPGAVQVEHKTATGSPLPSSGSNRTRGEKQENRASSTLTFCDTHSVARSWNYITLRVHTWQRRALFGMPGRHPVAHPSNSPLYIFYTEREAFMQLILARYEECTDERKFEEKRRRKKKIYVVEIEKQKLINDYS